MKPSIGIVGASGFLGWHVRCALTSMGFADPTLINRGSFRSATSLAEDISGLESIIFVAGTNRGSELEIHQGNTVLAEALSTALGHTTTLKSLVFANSVHSSADTFFGAEKARMAEIFQRAADTQGFDFVNVVLPHIFGEEGKPQYNSFVATFADEVARNVDPVVVNDRELFLLHAQEAADLLIRAATDSVDSVMQPKGAPIRIGAVKQILSDFASVYRQGEIPEITSPLELDLFNTLRSSMWRYSKTFKFPQHSDARGSLGELVRSHASPSQVFFSTTRPGQTRGGHFHRKRLERFLVVNGTGLIRVRKLFTPDVFSIQVDGNEPTCVDMPTFWTHDITNVGQNPMVTLFYQNSLLRSGAEDTFAEAVV